jgi:hypothetical protein
LHGQGPLSFFLSESQGEQLFFSPKEGHGTPMQFLGREMSRESNNSGTPIFGDNSYTSKLVGP